MAADRRQGPAAAVRQRNGDQQCAFLTHAIEEEAQLDHTLHERLETTELTEANLINATIYGPDDETIGSISHVHGSGADAQVIVDVGGFLGIGAKPVALQVSQLDFMRDEDGDVHATASLTKAEVKALPEHHH